MCRAGGLLRETDLSVKEIANRLGYEDQFYFSRLFKLVNGISPRAYRLKIPDMNSERPGQRRALAYLFVER
jgi:AraC-like DNA-binding protein